jgi:hypothetical protein
LLPGIEQRGPDRPLVDGEKPTAQEAGLCQIAEAAKSHLSQWQYYVFVPGQCFLEKSRDAN